MQLALDDNCSAGIKWGGILQVEFETNVEPEVFAKAFDGCKRVRPTRKQEPNCEQEPGEVPPDDSVTVQLNKEDMLRVFGKVK